MITSAVKSLLESSLYKKVCALFILLGLFLRVIHVQKNGNIQLYDFKTYNELATNIANGLGHTLNGEPMAWSSPAYSYALGIYYRLTGVMTELNGKYFNIICSVITLIACFFIIDKLFSNKKAVVACFGILCTFPNYIAYTSVLGTEVFFTMLLAIVICISLYGSGIKAYVITGVVLGLLVLTKPTMLVYPTVLAGIMWIQKNLLKNLFCILLQ